MVSFSFIIPFDQNCVCWLVVHFSVVILHCRLPSFILRLEDTRTGDVMTLCWWMLITLLSRSVHRGHMTCMTSVSSGLRQSCSSTSLVLFSTPGLQVSNSYLTDGNFCRSNATRLEQLTASLSLSAQSGSKSLNDHFLGTRSLYSYFLHKMCYSKEFASLSRRV